MNKEPLLGVVAAAAKAGLNICEKTVVNWSTIGIGGLKLKTVLQNGQYLTSMQALQRFFFAARQKRVVDKLYQEMLWDRVVDGMIRLKKARQAPQ
jgi:hypothetical protein